MNASLTSFKFTQPKTASADELLANRPELAARLANLNQKYQAASKHYKRCINKQSSYLLSSQTEKAEAMRSMVIEMKNLKTELIKKRKALEESLLHEEMVAIRALPEV